MTRPKVEDLQRFAGFVEVESRSIAFVYRLSSLDNLLLEQKFDSLINMK